MTTDLPPAVAAFHRDLDEIGPLSLLDEAAWDITPELAAMFRHHRDALIPVAEGGNAAAQCALAYIYYGTLLHTSWAAATAAYAEDIRQATHWLERAAASGDVGGLDSLLVVGVGAEADRLRSIFKRHPERFRNAPAPSAAWEAEMKLLHAMAYGGRGGACGGATS